MLQRLLTLHSQVSGKECQQPASPHDRQPYLTAEVKLTTQEQALTLLTVIPANGKKKSDYYERNQDTA
jgi:hypothetical protein